MSMELKDKIQKDLKKRNITPQTVKQTFFNSFSGIPRKPVLYYNITSVFLFWM